MCVCVSQVEKVELQDRAQTKIDELCELTQVSNERRNSEVRIIVTCKPLAVSISPTFIFLFLSLIFSSHAIDL